MDRVSSNIIKNDFNKEKEKQMKKTAKKKTRIESIVDLVDCHLDEEITKDELIEKLMTLIGKPIIKISEMEFIVNEWKGNLYLNCRSTFKDGTKDNWVDVSDLTDFTVCEYNDLECALSIHYPDYPIEYLEGRFV